MIPYEIDPSLHDGEHPQRLDDGFSPPEAPEGEAKHGAPTDLLEAALAAKSDF